MLKATIKEVAVEAEVSTATVSRVLNNSLKVSDEARQRVSAAIAKLNYEPSAIARSLKQDRTYMIGIIVPDITNPYFMEISKGIEDTVGQNGFQLMFCSSDENSDKESRLLQLLNEKRVDAVVVATAGGNESKIESMSCSGLPVVLIDRSLENHDGLKQLDLIAENNSEGAYMLANRLLEDGHSALGVVNGPSWVSTGRERYDGVLRAMREWGIEQPPHVYNGDFSVEGGIRAVRSFWQAACPPTAIVSLNNRMTFGVLIELIRRGLRIPSDVAIASFGEVEAGQLLKSPKLYYIDQQALPLSVPIMVPLTIGFFLTNWNAYMWPLIITQDEKLWVVQQQLAHLVGGGYFTPWNVVLAAAVIVAIPTFILFFVAQKYLVEGIKMSGIK